jgi:hypothetical protein
MYCLRLQADASIPAFGTVMCKSQEIEGLGLCPFLCTVITGKASELNQPALFFLKT